MSVESDFVDVPAFSCRRPEIPTVPFVFSSPHSGRNYPKRFLDLSRLDETTIRRSEDCFVDELFASVVALGAPLLVAHFPRAYLDVNREPWELDPRMYCDPLPAHVNSRSARVAGGLGTVPRIVGEGQEIYSGRISFSEAAQRIEKVYQPYHEALRQLMLETHARFGTAVLVDCHSMPASVRVSDMGARPDFIIGDRFGTSAAASLTRSAIEVLSAMGYTVAHNKPYAGGFITEHYGRPACGLHAIQIEINRGLYMEERTYRKTSGFDALADDLRRFVLALTSQYEMDGRDLPLAAE